MQDFGAAEKAREVAGEPLEKPAGGVEPRPVVVDAVRVREEMSGEGVVTEEGEQRQQWGRVEGG